MKKTHLFIFFLIVIMIHCSCSVNVTETNRKILRIDKIISIRTEYPVKKVLYNKWDGTQIVLPDNSNEVYLYKNGQFFNKIGGSGFSQSNFKKISDICLSEDQGFYILDSFDKLLKKFNTKGEYIGSVSLKEMMDPWLADVDKNGNLFIFDRGRREILILDKQSFKPIVSFARFQFEKPDRIVFSADKLLVYEKGHTALFDATGRMDREYEQTYLYDSGRNQVFLNDGMLKTSNQELLKLEGLSGTDSIYAKENYIYYQQGQSLSIYEIIYE